MENKQCQQCSKTFQIKDQDLEFYKKIFAQGGSASGRNVPEPTQCPECRRQQRLSWRNERTLYSRSCSMCNKSIISVYSTDKPFPVYCGTCWYSDNWEVTDYGKEFDFSRPFFEQFRELLDTTPRLYMQSQQCENSEYCNYSYKNKNCYLVFGSHYEENCLYGNYSSKNKDCLDYYGCYQSELCFESIQSNHCYACVFIDHCENCTETYFSIDLKGCRNCLFSVNLRNQQYCIFNQQYSKEEYEKKFKELKLETRQGFENAIHIFNNQVRIKYPIRYAYLLNCENCDGDDHMHCKNVHSSFNGTNSENCTYAFKFDETYDSMDVDCMGYDRSELCYQLIGGSGDFHCRFLDSCWHCTDLTYSNLCFNSKNSFGCVGLVKKQYCILNKQYSEIEYKKIIPKIIKHMQQTKEWGNFFSKNVSLYAYNETVAQLNFPLRKEEVTSLGYRWKDLEEVNSKAQTVELVSNINDATDNSINDIWQCNTCKKNYRIVKYELELLKKIQIPLPVNCSQCRFVQRCNSINPKKLWHRQCMCVKPKHAHQGRCAVEFATTYSPDRKEIVYCGDCYKKEIY